MKTNSFINVGKLKSSLKSTLKMWRPNEIIEFEIFVILIGFDAFKISNNESCGLHETRDRNYGKLEH